MTENDAPESTARPSGNGHDPSLLPQIPQQPALSLTLPPPNRASSLAGISTQSMRTSSFAMSDDLSEKLAPFESLRIRKAYSRTPTSRMSVPEDDNVSEKHIPQDLETTAVPTTDRYVSVGSGKLI
jgi:hypothetical protein